MNNLAQDIHKMVRNLDPALNPDDESYKVAVVLLSSAVVGTDPLTLAQLTGYSDEWINQIGARFTENGIWVDGNVFGDWADPDVGGTSFWLDVLAGRGFLVRSEGEPVPS